MSCLTINFNLIYYAPPPVIGGGIKRCFCLTSDVCLSRTSGIGLGHHFQGQKFKRQGHQAALLSASITRKAAAAVSVGTYSAWECTATLRLLGSARQGEERAGAYCVATRTAYCSYECFDFAAIIFITKLRSSHRHQRTSTNFLQLDALPVAQPTLSEH